MGETYRRAEEQDHHRAVQAAIGRAMKAHYQTLMAEPLPQRIFEAIDRLAHVDAKATRGNSPDISNDHLRTTSALRACEMSSDQHPT